MKGLRQMGRMRFLLLFAAVCAWSFAARGAEDDAVLELWKQHMAAADDHETALKVCRDFATAHPGDPLLPMVRGLEEWHLLRSGRRSDVLKMLAVDLVAPPGAVTDGARRVAQGWLTREDRDQVAAALQGYYRKNVAYPKTLDQLPTDARPPMADRFGKPWNYKLAGFAKVKGFADQKYALESAALGDTSDFKAALKLPYAARITAVPVEVVALPGGKQAVKFNVGGSPAVVGVGQAAGDLYLAFVGAKIVVVCDCTHWKIIPRP